MTREDYVEYCKMCKHKKFDSTNGVTCNLTNDIPNFNDQCAFFEEEENVLKTTLVDKLEQNKASLGKRFTNYIIDIIFVTIIAGIIGFFYGMFIGYFRGSDIDIVPNGSFFIRFLAYLMVFLYYTVFEASFGKTFGKMITNTKVVSTVNGEKPTFGTAMLRSIIRYVPFEVLSFFGKSNTGWHDRWSNTIVVNN